MPDRSCAPTALHLSPHPDDEVIGAPAHLLALTDAGWQVINFAVSLGRPANHARRRREVQEACRRAGFRLHVPSPAYALSADDDLANAERRLTAEVEELIDEHRVQLVVSPSPHDRHHGHEVVARAARRAIERHADRTGTAPAWWMWGLWADLPMPTVACVFDQTRLRAISAALQAHAGEVARNDYVTLVAARAQANHCLAAERVFGFGSAKLPGAFAEMITETVLTDDGWHTGAARLLDAGDPLPDDIVATVNIDWWLDMPSVTDRIRHLGCGGPADARP